jgi:hypothetical protein
MQEPERDEEPPEWERRPQTEEEAEAMQARSDRLVDRIEARLRREGEEANYEQILEEEIERLHREEGRPEPTPEQLERNAEWIDEMNRAAEEALSNPDPEAEKGAGIRAPTGHAGDGIFPAIASKRRKRRLGDRWMPATNTR